MAQINVNIEHLLKVASKLEETGDDVSGYSGSLEGIRDEVEVSWKSESTGTYVEELMIVKRNLAKLSGEADELAKAIRTYVAEIKRIERENAQMFNQ